MGCVVSIKPRHSRPAKFRVTAGKLAGTKGEDDDAAEIQENSSLACTDRQTFRNGHQLSPDLRIVEFSDRNMQSGRRDDLLEAFGDSPFDDVVPIKKLSDDEHSLVSQEFQDGTLA